MKAKAFLFCLLAVVAALSLPAQAGSWKAIGKAGDWAGTIAGVALDGKIYTVESSGALFVTEPASGAWKQVGKSDFANTRFLFASGGILFSIEKDGSLYAISPGDGLWGRLGKMGDWAGTIAGVAAGNRLFTVDASGALYVTDLATGSWKGVGKSDFANTKFLFAGAGRLFSIEKDGSLYAINPADGSWQRVGAAGSWAGTICGIGAGDKLLTVEAGGALYETDTAGGVWKQLGQPAFAATRFMFFCGGMLYTIEKSGSLYQVSLGGKGAAAASVAAPAGAKPVISEKSSAAVAGNLTFAFMGKWVGDTATYEKEPTYKEALKTSPEMAKAALGMLKSMAMTVTLDGITMDIMGEKIGPIAFSVITSSGNTLTIESREPGKPATRQDIVFLDASHIKMAEKGQESKALFLVKK
jgi:hypothetical protein